MVGYIISIYGTGVPQWYYLIPVKLVAFCFMLVAGNGIYYVAEEKIPMLIASFRALKYTLLSFLLLFLFGIIQAILNQYSVDLTPIVGM